MLWPGFPSHANRCGESTSSKATKLKRPTAILITAFAAALLLVAGFCGSGSAFQVAAGQPRIAAHNADDQKKAVPAAAPAPIGQAPPLKAPKAAESINATPAVRAEAATDAKASAVEPLRLEYVPRDAVIVAAFRPSAILNCAAFASLNEFLSKRLEADKLIGIPLESIRQLTVVFMLEEGPSFNTVRTPDGTAVIMNAGGRVIEPEPVGVIFHLAHSEDVAAMANAFAPDSEESSYAGRAYIRRKGEGDAPSCLLADDLTVVVADEAHLRRLIVAGRTSASKAKWTQAWKQAAGSDLAVLTNVTAIRNLIALKQKELDSNDEPKVNPPSAAPLFDSETALLTVDIRDRIVARLQLAAKSSNDLERIHAAVKALIELSQAAMSGFRESASSDASENGSELLGAIEILDSTLDSVAVVTQRACVEAAASMSMDDATKMVAAWLAIFAESDDGDNETAIDPSPAELYGR